MKSVSIKQIVEETGYSRNTVSKALNNKGVPTKTMEIIINKAVELGYKGFSKENIIYQEAEKPLYNFLILMKNSTLSLNFFSAILRGITHSTHRKNEIINTIPFTTEKMDRNQMVMLQTILDEKKINGIICFETFDDESIDIILKTNLPTIFIDSKVFLHHETNNYDVLLMNNYDNIYKLTCELAKTGVNKVGFVGDHFHCRGFHERYLGCLSAAHQMNYDDLHKYSILVPESEARYGEYNWLRKKFLELPIVPDAFVCANDSIAINLLSILQDLGHKIPTNIQVIGFDNVIEAEFSKPKLTTVNTPKEIMGQDAIDLLINRLNHKQSTPRTIYVDTQIMYRNSTRL